MLYFEDKGKMENPIFHQEYKANSVWFIDTDVDLHVSTRSRSRKNTACCQTNIATLHDNFANQFSNDLAVRRNIVRTVI